MIGRKACLAILALALAAPALAQDRRVEIGGNVGWNFSDGVTFDGVLAGDGAIYDGIEPADAFSWGLDIGYFVTPSVQVGFLFSQQMSTMQVTGTRTVEIGDWNVNNYHGFVSYHTGDFDSRARAYFLLGLGATQYGSVPFSVGGQTFETGGETQFSGTFGIGVKLNSSGPIGLKLGARWTPTYIKSDEEGWWCDPYWGCYVVGDAQYSNQFELSGGLVIRF
jgi:hypothetical protein